MTRVPGVSDGATEATVIVCPRCSKENQDHYKFCLGCGAELPRNAQQQPKSFTAPTPPAGFSGDGGAGAGPAAGPAAAGAQFGGAAAAPTGGQPAPAAARPVAAPPAAAPAAPPAAAPAPPSSGGAPAAAPDVGGEIVKCPKCSANNPRSFKFCGSCGFNLQDYLAAGGSAGAVPAAPAPAPAPAGGGKGALVLIRPDGTEGEAFPLADGATAIGRDTGPIFASDSYLSPKHATFTFSADGLHVADESSLNGVFMRIERDAHVTLNDRSVFRIGQEIIRFEKLPAVATGPDGVELMGGPNPGFLGRICLITGRESVGNSYCVPVQGLHLGRERGDIIFPDDGYVSGLHCRIFGEGGKVVLTDVGSSNGTFIRIGGKTAVKSGSLLLMGQQLFRVEY